MTEGITCYERDEALCEDQMCLRTGCRLRNERLSPSYPVTTTHPADDERPLPTYGQIPWRQLGRDVNESTTGSRFDFEFGHGCPGHVIVPGINFNSLARIVDKYRYYGLTSGVAQRQPEPAAWIDAAALQAAHEIVALSESWTYTRKKAAIQVIVAREMARAASTVSSTEGK